MKVIDDQQQELRSRMNDISAVVQGLVTRDATMAFQVTNLVSMFSEHKGESKSFMGDAREALATISEQVTTTNGRVNGHDDHFVVNDREIRDLKETMTWAIRVLVGLNVTVIGGVIVAAIAYWMNHK